MTDWLALACLLFFAVRGYLKGFIPALFGILALVLGYAAMFTGAEPLGNIFVERELLPKLIAYSAAGLVIFVAVQFILGAVSRALEKRLSPTDVKKGMGRAYWFAGGAIGLVSGACVAMIIVWGVLFYRAARAQIKSGEKRRGPETISERVTSRAMTAIARTLAGTKRAEDSALLSTVLRVVEDPQEGIDDIKKKVRKRLPSVGAGDIGESAEEILENPAIKELMDDERFKKRLDQTMRQLPLEDYRNDPKIQKLLKKHQ